MYKRMIALITACLLIMLTPTALAAAGAPSLALSGTFDHLFHIDTLNGQRYLVENEFISCLVWGDSPGELIPIAELFTLDPSWAVSVVSADGTPVDPHEDGTLMKTGDIITVSSDAGSDSLTIIKRGDLNGDGYSNIADIVQLAAALTGSASLEGAMLWTADFNGNGRVDTADLVSLVRLAFYTG